MWGRAVEIGEEEEGADEDAAVHQTVRYGLPSTNNCVGKVVCNSRHPTAACTPTVRAVRNILISQSGLLHP